MKARPRTRSTLARIEPMSAAWTTPDQTRPEREDPEEELGEVPESRLDDAGHP